MSRVVGAAIVTVIGLGMLTVCGLTVSAGEHGGKEHGGAKKVESKPIAKEHGGKEHGGTTSQAAPVKVQEPSARDIRGTIRDHVKQVKKDQESFTIEDSETGATRELRLVRVHQRVGKTGSLFYSCTDMKDVENGELLDLDFDVDVSGGDLKVVDVRIHKVDGEARYTYDDDDNRISLL